MAGAYAVTLGIFGVVMSLLPDSTQDAISQATSTNIAHLSTRPLFVLVTSAFIAPAQTWLWVPLALVLVGGLERRLGAKRALFIAFGAHMLASLLSEGLLLLEIYRHQAPASDVRIVDVGPSYVMLAAVAGGLIVGRKWLRIAAVVAGSILIPGMLVGLDGLDMTAVGHLLALFFGSVIAFGFVLVPRMAAAGSLWTAGRRALAAPISYGRRLLARYSLPAGTPLPPAPNAAKGQERQPRSGLALHQPKPGASQVR